MTGVADAAACSNLRLLHYTSGAWNASTNASPIFSGGICTVSRVVNSFSPFAVANAPAVPTAAEVTVGGRITSGKGRGIRSVIVTMTDADGSTRTAVSSTFGYYRFDKVAAGNSYIIEVRAKRFTFDQPVQLVTITEENLGIDFTAN